MQLRVLSVALAVDNAEQRRLRGEMLAFGRGSEDRRNDLNTCGGSVAVTADGPSDGYPSGYVWNARGPVGDFLLDASTSREWYGSR